MIEIQYDKVTHTLQATGFENSQGVYHHPEGINIFLDSFITISKDFYSTTPVFYLITEQYVLASSSFMVLFSHFYRYFQQIALNPCFAIDYIKYQTPLTNQTLVLGIYVLRSGERVHIRGDEIWRDFIVPPPESHRKRYRNSDLRSLLRSSLNKHVGREAVYHLSSGLDSSLLALLVSREFTSARLQLASCRTLGKGAGQELDVVQRLAEDIGGQLISYDLTDIDVLDEGIAFIHETGIFPIAHPSHLTRYLLDKNIAKNQAELIVTGRGPDELISGYTWHLPEYAIPELHHRRICSTRDCILQTLLRPAVYSAGSSPASCAYATLMASGSISLSRRLLYDRWTLTEAWNILDGALSEALGVEYASPFLDPEVASFLDRLPEEDKVRNGELKYYFKSEFKDLYPGYILEQPKRGLGFDINVYLRQYHVREIVRNIWNSSDFVRRTFQPEGLREIIEQTLSGKQAFGWQIWSVYLLGVAAGMIEKKELPDSRGKM